MAGVRLLDAVDRERPDRVDGEPVEGGIRRGSSGGRLRVGRAAGQCRKYRSGHPHNPAPRRSASVSANGKIGPSAMIVVAQRPSPVARRRIRLERGRGRRDRVTDRCRRQGRDRGDVLVPGREVLRPEPVRHDAHPEVGHVERRVATGAATPSATARPPTPAAATRTARGRACRAPASASRVQGRPADAAVRPTRPPSRSRRRGQPTHGARRRRAGTRSAGSRAGRTRRSVARDPAALPRGTAGAARRSAART